MRSIRTFRSWTRPSARMAPSQGPTSPTTRRAIKTTGRVHDGKTLYYRASKFDCEACPLKARCCPKSPERRISRDLNEAARDTTRALMETEAYAASSGERKKIERLFGEAKSILSMVRLRLRGLARGPGRVLADRHRPEPEKAGQSHRKTAATAHDGLIHAAKTPPTRPTTHNRLNKLRRKRKTSAISISGY